MSCRTTLTITTLILFLVAASAIVPSSCAVEWSADIRLTLENSSDFVPSIAEGTDGNLWVVWSSDRTGNYELFYTVYDGSSWSDPIQLTTDPNYDRDPAIMRDSGGNIWVVWSSDRTGNYELFYTVYDGSSWSDPIQLTTEPQYDFHPAIMEATDGNIWVVWHSDRNLHDLDLYYKVFNGSSWSSDVQLTADPYWDDYEPSILQDMGGLVWIVFSKFNSTDDRPMDIYYKVFNGTLWSKDIQLTWDPEGDESPSVTRASDGAIWVVWMSHRNGHDWNIYYKVFRTYWTPDTKLTTDQSGDYWPSITQAADGTIWVVWTSTRSANFDIYYKKTITSPYHDIAVIRVKTDPTIAFRSENVSIEVTTQNQGTYGETVEVRCYANSTLIGSKTIFLSPGQTHILYPPLEWDTSDFRRGNYTISANVTAVTGETDLADNHKKADGLVEVRLLGDICGMYGDDILPIPNGMVDGLDFAVIALPSNIFSEYPSWDPVWGPICDLNKDGKIGVADLMLVGIHYGET